MRLASACAALAAGLAVCARHAREDRTEEIVTPLAESMAVLASQAWSLGVELGHERRRGARTCERLRWEWLASTASLLDGAPDVRLAAECARVASGAREDARLVERSLEDGPPRRVAHAIAAALDRAHAALDEAVRSSDRTRGLALP